MTLANHKAKKSMSLKFLFKEIFWVALPMAVQSVLLTSVQLIDNLFIGHLESATNVASALNAINNITFAINSVTIGFMGGIGIYFAQASGKGDEELKKMLFIAKAFWTFLWSALLISLAIIFLTPISSIWLPSKGDLSKTHDAAWEYGSIIFPSLLLDYVVVLFSSTYKEQKRTRLAMYVAIVAIAVNSSLNYPFMYTLKMGVKGSAYATLIARFTEAIVWIGYITYTKHAFIPKIKDFFSIKFSDLWKVFPKSFMWMLTSFLTSLAFTIQIMFMSRVSTESGASLNAAGAIAQIMHAFNGGFATAMGIIIMHRLASDKNLDLKLYIRKLVIISGVFGLITGSFLASLSWSVFYIYPNYNYETKFDSMIMIIAIGAGAWWGLINTVYTSALKGGGYSKILLIADGIYSWVITIPTTIILIYVVTDDVIQFGYIYWIVAATGVFKPIILRNFFLKYLPKFRTLLSNDFRKEKQIRETVYE